MANAFDQFDALEQQPAAQGGAATTPQQPAQQAAANPFDQFDALEQQPAAQEQHQPRSIMGELMQGIGEAGRALITGGAKIADIIPSVGNAALSAGAWAGKQLGIGDGTYTPAAMVSDYLPDSVTPQTQAGQVAAEAVPYFVNPTRGVMRAGTTLAERGAGLLAENAVGALANNTGAGNDANATGLLTDLAAGAATSGAVRGVTAGAGALYRGLRGTAGGEAAEVARFADQNNLPLMTTDVNAPGTFVGRSAQAAAEKIPVTGTGRLRQGQQEAREQLLSDYASRFAPPSPGEIYNSLQQRGGQIKKAAGNRLNRIVERMDTNYAYIPANNTAAALDVEIGRLRQLGEAADTATINKLEAYRREIATNRPTFSQMQSLRSQFRQDVKGERTAWPSSAEAAVNRVYNAMSSDLSGAVARDLGPEEARRFQQANSIYAREAENVNRTRLKNILQKGDLTPEVVNNLLFSNKPSEVRQLYNSLNNDGRAAARNAIIGKAMEQAQGSPQKFLTAARKLSNQTGIFFKGEDRAYLEGMKKYLEATERASRAGVVTPTGQELSQFLLPAGVATDIATNGGVATISGATFGALSRLYESKPVRNAMIKMASTPRGSTEFERHLSTVNNALIPVLQGARQEATQ